MSFIKQYIKNINILIYIKDKVKEFYFKHLISDEKLINKRFNQRQGRDVNLINPIHFNDKLQWLKLYWNDPIATKCADKFEVREHIEEKIGGSYLNKLLAVYESVDEINLDKLPCSFVLKGTHGSGYNIICKNKDDINWKQEFKKMRRWLRQNYYWSKREWVYKDIKPKIICEEYLLDEESESSLTDYKIYCFNGKPTYCQVIQDRQSGEVGSIDFFDTQWNHMEFTGLQKAPHSAEKIPKPNRYEEMLNLAAKLSEDFPFVRVDFYYVNEIIYFGELTFFPQSGFGKFYPEKWNKRIGDLLQLPAD